MPAVRAQRRGDVKPPLRRGGLNRVHHPLGLLGDLDVERLGVDLVGVGDRHIELAGLLENALGLGVRCVAREKHHQVGGANMRIVDQCVIGVVEGLIGQSLGDLGVEDRVPADQDAFQAAQVFQGIVRGHLLYPGRGHSLGRGRRCD